MSVNIVGHFTGDTKLCKQYDNLNNKAKKLRKDQDKVIKKLKANAWFKRYSANEKKLKELDEKIHRKWVDIYYEEKASQRIEDRAREAVA